MVVLAHNLVAMFTDRQLNISSGNKTKSAEKLSSGYRINRASDDAAGLKISEKMRSQIRGLDQGKRNTTDGISFIQVADGAMSEMHVMLQRVRELAVQASNDTNTSDEREAIQQEISQIKKEINNISLNTQFNNEDVFDNSYTMMQVEGTPKDLNFFNGSYDAATGKVTYGGFIFRGNRITWDKINADMVSVDANGKQIFKGGSYTYIDALTGDTFNVTCSDGAEVPKITRTIGIKADTSGIYIDGKRHGWNELKNEDGKGLTHSNVGAGTWTINYEGADISFFVGNDVQSIEDMAKAIDACKTGKVSYSLHTKYAGAVNEKGVDADAFIDNLHISNAFAQYITQNTGVSIAVRAGDGTNGTKNGIWLEQTDGTEIVNSFLSWADMGIDSWTSGSDINSTITYRYSDTEGMNDTLLSFDFKLSDVTSLDSVIDGLDDMILDGKNITTDYETNLNVTQDANIKKVQSEANNPIYFLEEKAFGRDFDQAVIDNLKNANLVYNKDNSAVTLEFKDGSNNVVISYTGDTTATKQNIMDSVDRYLDYVIKKKTEAALDGKDPQNITLESKTLSDLVGTGNITTSGYFDGLFTPDGNNMEMTDGESWAKPGKDGETYPTAYIDFKDLGTGFTLDDLVGTGFNSTCKTCSNHYSVMFVDGISNPATTANGYTYSSKKQGQDDYLLQIDISALKAKNITSGEDLAKALVEITSECYDFHYTQYAADGSKFYIYDNRESLTGTRDATFDTTPYYSMDMDSFNLTVETADGRNISTDYAYDFGDVAGNVEVKMKEDAAGDYIKKADGTYEKYNAADYPDPANQPQRYTMEVVYKKADGTAAANAAEALSDYADGVLKKLADSTNVQLDAQDYTYIDMAGDEKANTAVNSEFEAYVEEKTYENVLHIQVSGKSWDSIDIPRIAMNTMKMRLFKADVTTWQGAQDAIEYADFAINFVSGQRALYGAYQNRLEHIYNNNANTEENTVAAESRLRDTDMAKEMLLYAQRSILEQAGQSVLAQANSKTASILELLQ